MNIFHYKKKNYKCNIFYKKIVFDTILLSDMYVLDAPYGYLKTIIKYSGKVNYV